MQCPECKGSKCVLVSRADGSTLVMGCPTCEGVGELPDPPQFLDNCLSCGQPIPEGQKWCDFHKAADLFGM